MDLTGNTLWNSCSSSIDKHQENAEVVCEWNSRNDTLPCRLFQAERNEHETEYQWLKN